MKALQYPPTGLSQPHKQLGTFRTPFERDVICNKEGYTTNYLNVSFLNFCSKICFTNESLGKKGYGVAELNRGMR